MEFDAAEFESIENDERYQDQVRRSREHAKTGASDKIVDCNLVEFYSAKDTCDLYGRFLTNCMYAKVEVDGVVYRSSAHYYQMQKFIIRPDDPFVIDWCRAAHTPVDVQIRNNAIIREQMAIMTPVHVAKYGQTMRSAPVRGDWERVKKSVMYRALVAKFTQNPELTAELKRTGGAILVERAPTDSIWAINSRGVGSNWLGIMLMMVRNILE